MDIPIKDKTFKNPIFSSASFILYPLLFIFLISAQAMMSWREDFETGKLDPKKWVFVKAEPTNLAEIVNVPSHGYALHIVGERTNSEVFTRISPGGGAPFKLTFSFYQPSKENNGYAGVVHHTGCTPMYSFWWLEEKPPDIRLWTLYKGEWAERWSASGIECDKWYRIELEDDGHSVSVKIYQNGDLLAKSEAVPHDTGFSGFGGPISFGAHTGGGTQGVFYDDIVIEYTSPPPSYSLPPDYSAKAPRLTLKSQKLSAEISKDRGWILSLKTAKGFSLFDKGMGVLSIGNVSLGKTYSDKDFSLAPSSLSFTSKQARMKQVTSDEEIEAETTYSLEGDALIWDVRLSAKNDEPQEGKISFVFPLPQWCEEIFLPMFGAPFRREEVPSYCGYRGGGNLSIPMATLYSEGKDVGLTILADPYAPKPSFSFSFNPQGNPPVVLLQWSNCRLQRGHPLHLRVFLANHQGDWRSGLKWVLGRFPEFFKPEMKVAEGHQVIMWERPRERLEWLRELGFAWGMSHLLKTPFYGKYFSEVNTEEEIKEKREFLNLCHQVDFHFYYYWSYIETEPKFAEENFSDSIARWTDGRPMLLGWGGFPWMVPYPGGKWHSYILDQLDKLLKALPEVDGVFVDNTGGSFVSYGQDDGITFMNNHPAYQYAFAQHNILREVKEKLKALGKGMWANGSCDLESARYMDGIMVESRADFLEAQRYLGLVKPMLFITYYDKNDPQRRERLIGNLKSALLSGVMLGFNEWELVPETIDLELLKRWLPLYEPLRGREWVLEAHALSLPKGIKGNIFKTGKGDYYIALVREGETVEGKFWVQVRVPDGKKIRSAKIYTPSEGRWRAIEMRRNGSAIEVGIEGLEEAGGILLEH
jgi:hypothetical protein